MEIASYVDVGIKPVDALRSATSVNAKVLKKDSVIGKIAKGFDADFVAVKGNPINDIRDITKTELVIRKGMVISQVKIQKDLKSKFDNIPNDAITLDFLDRIK